MDETAVIKRKIGPDERRERRRLRREKQRADNIGRAEKMHLARLAATLPERQQRALAKLRLCRLFRMVLLEMARSVLPSRAADKRMVQSLCRSTSTPSKSTHPSIPGRPSQM